MPDLHGWITQRVGHLEALCRSADKEHGRDWAATWTARTDDFELLDTNGTLVARNLQPGAAGLLALHDPAGVLRRCEADRRILARHRLDPDASWMDAAACEGCGTEGEMDYARTENLNDCPELLDLGYAHGLTVEILAGLDRPQDGERPKRTGQSFIADALADAMYGQLFATFLGTRPIEPSPQEKAIKILGPELKKISGYVPIAEDDSPA